MEVKIEHRLTVVEDKVKNAEQDITELKKRQNNLEKLTSTVEKLAIREENVESTVKEIKDDVKTLTNKSAKRWDGIVEKAVSAVVGGLIAYVFFKLGLG